VILVASALSDRSDAKKLATLLAPHFTVINYDRRGRSESGDTPPYAVLVLSSPCQEPLRGQFVLFAVLPNGNAQGNTRPKMMPCSWLATEQKGFPQVSLQLGDATP
jgi:hypothetical protein